MVEAADLCISSSLSLFASFDPVEKAPPPPQNISTKDALACFNAFTFFSIVVENRSEMFGVL